MDAAIRHRTKGIGIWDWVSNDQGAEPNLVTATCGDIPTQEALAATALLCDRRTDCVRHADEHGIDPPELAEWAWPF